MKLVRADELVSKMKKFGFRSNTISIESFVIDELDSIFANDETNQLDMSPDEVIEVLNGSMPIFNKKCFNCGAMCFDDDCYCAECGAKFI